MGIQAYIDDSGSGGDSAWFVLAGYTSSKDAWDRFGPAWSEALREPPSIDVFKSSQAESLKGAFAGFTRDQADAKIAKLITVIRVHAERALHIRVKQKHYNRIIRANGLPAIWDDPYYFLFMGLLSMAVSMEKHLGDNEAVEFIFDSNQRLERPSNRLRRQMDDVPLFTNRIADVRFQNDRDTPGLQSADLLAWQLRRRFSVSQEPKRVHFEKTQKCCGSPPFWGYVLTEADLYMMLNAMKDRELDFKKQHALPIDFPLWHRDKRKRRKT